VSCRSQETAGCASASSSRVLDGPVAPGTEPGAITDEQATVGGVLRWLLGETEGESAVYVRLGPSGTEHFVLEPRGLASPDVAELVHQARHAMLHGQVEAEVNEAMALSRWMGKDGSKIVLLRGVTAAEASEPMRFARFIIEWMASREQDTPSLERRLLEVPGVAWAEMAPGDPPGLRLILDKDADLDVTRHAVARTVGDAALNLEEIGSAPGEDEDTPRIRLIDLTVGTNDGTSVDVLLDWRGQRLRGRGRGQSTEEGRCYASAQAVADAMKLLLDSDVDIEGVYRADADDEHLDVLVVCVRVAGVRYVGAVPSVKGQENVSGARAVLDALNRRLPEIAGKGGRV
jgi:hypothetical protein